MAQKPPDDLSKGVGEPLPEYHVVQDDELMEGLRKFRDDHLWVTDHREALLKDYAEQWIAVRDKRVIASDPDFESLIRRLEDPGHTCVEFITRRPLEVVL